MADLRKLTETTVQYMMADASAPHSLGLMVRGVGVCTREFRTMNRIENRRFPGWVLIYVYRGKGYFESEEMERQRVYAGDAFWLNPAHRHSYGVSRAESDPLKTESWTEIWMWFDGPRFLELIGQGGLPVTPPLVEHCDTEWLERALLQALDVAHGGSTGGREEGERWLLRLPGLGHQVLDALMQAERRPPPMPEHQAQVCEAVREVLATRFAERLDLEELALAHGVSYASLRMRFKQRFGLAMLEYQNRERVNRASELLFAGVSVREAADAVGFSDTAFFSRLFKRLTGVPPSRFRG